MRHEPTVNGYSSSLQLSIQFVQTNQPGLELLDQALNGQKRHQLFRAEPQAWQFRADIAAVQKVGTPITVELHRHAELVSQLGDVALEGRQRHLTEGLQVLAGTRRLDSTRALYWYKRAVSLMDEAFDLV